MANEFDPQQIAEDLQLVFQTRAYIQPRLIMMLESLPLDTADPQVEMHRQTQRLIANYVRGFSIADRFFLGELSPQDRSRLEAQIEAEREEIMARLEGRASH